MEFTTIQIRQYGPLAYVGLNHPDKANAVDERMWQELRAAMQWVDRTAAVRAAVLSGSGWRPSTGSTRSRARAGASD